jgi:3-oxoacyl-[acyl-carrier protein] reductase
MTDAHSDDGAALKLHGARRLTIQAWDALKASNGSVVLISGSAALDPKPGFAAVAAINAAIIALAKAFAEQGIKDGVQVNSVVRCSNDWTQAIVLREMGTSQSHGGRGDQEISGGPVLLVLVNRKRLRTCWAYVVSPAAKWMTGASLRMDGGEIKGI